MANNVRDADGAAEAVETHLTQYFGISAHGGKTFHHTLILTDLSSPGTYLFEDNKFGFGKR